VTHPPTHPPTGLSNVSVVWSRAEDGGQSPQHRGKYDLAVARAVAETRVLAELCLPFVRVGGLWVAPKGPSPDAEVAAASRSFSQLGATLLATELVESFSADGQRTCIVASKVRVCACGGGGRVCVRFGPRSDPSTHVTTTTTPAGHAHPSQVPPAPGHAEQGTAVTST
jgi:hypothetical protein